jgi:hypothetical protein
MKDTVTLAGIIVNKELWNYKNKKETYWKLYSNLTT